MASESAIGEITLSVSILKKTGDAQLLVLGGLIRGQARAEIISNFAIGKKWRTRRKFCVARKREIQHNSLKLRVGETKRELVGQFAAPYLAAWIVRGIWLRNWTFRQNAIGEKSRAVRLTCRSGQQRRDW